LEDFVSHQSIANNPLWKERSPRLRSLDIELTERCDNACQHCYINLPREDAAARKAEWSAGEWKNLLAQAAALGALSVRFTGGEPLLRDDFAEIYEAARRLGLKVTLFTNARRITPALVALFQRIPPLQKIEITVYGMRAETYEAVSRAPGSFAEFRRGVDLLLAGGVPFAVKSVDLPQTTPDLQAFQDWAASLPGMEVPAGVTRVLDLRARRDSAARMRHIAALRAAPEDVAGKILAGKDARAEMLRLARNHGGKAGAPALWNCGAGQCALPCIDAYGRMQACMLLRAPRLGYDLRTGSLQDALESHFPRLKTIRPENPAYLERCGRCFLRGMCDQCAAKSWMESGTLDTPVEYLCQVTHALARQMGLLAAGEHTWQIEDGARRVARMTGEEA
jgi:radical SAM protein with 4Fe4S-binding SPASM domain